MSDVAARRKVTILVADDYPVIRRGVVAVLSAQPGFAVVAEAEDADSVVSNIERLEPDVVVLDLGMPGVRGLELVRDLRLRFPPMGVLIYTAHREEDIALACLKSG